jgi:hypothetical protein
MSKTAPAADLGSLQGLLAAVNAAAQATRPVRVDVPQLGGAVWVRRMTTQDVLDASLSALPEEATPAQRKGWDVARWICNEAGERLVPPDQMDALAAFAALPWEASRRILDAAGVMDGADEKNA